MNPALDSRARFEAHWRTVRGAKKAANELRRHPTDPQVYINDSANRHFVTWGGAWQAAIASMAASDKSLHAQAADLLRPFLKPGDKVIWRGSFRWFDDDGVLSNHYDSQELESLAADFGYQIDWDFNLKHAAIIRATKETT